MITLNPALDAPALAAAFAAKGRIQIRDVLVEADARRVQAMLRATPWSLAFNEGEKVHRLSPDDQRRLSPGQAQQMMADIQQRARGQFQFLYEYDPIFVRYFTPAHPPMPVFEVYEFLNSPAMLDLFRTVTGHPDIRWADAQATLFRPGHFLKRHDDINHRERRVAAFVLNFSESWQPGWGGYLQFYTPDGDVEEALKPLFNAVNLFAVPADHDVAMVSSFAPAERLSITGWLRADAPPGPIPRR